MIDAILYVPDFPALVQHLATTEPDMLAQTEDGSIAQPPVITAFSRTPAQVNGDQVMVYARLRPHQAEQWRGMPGVEVLAETEYSGEGTARRLIDQFEGDPEALAKYESVSPRAEYIVTDEDGTEYTQRPPRIFGIMAGAGGNLGWD